MSSDREATLELMFSTRALLSRAQSDQARRYAYHRDVMAQIGEELESVSRLLNSIELEDDTVQTAATVTRVHRFLSSVGALHRTIEAGTSEEQDFRSQIDALCSRVQTWEQRLSHRNTPALRSA